MTDDPKLLESEHDPETALFLAALTELSRKHGLIVVGCEYSHSPWITAIDPGSKGRYTYDAEDSGRLEWNEHD